MLVERELPPTSTPDTPKQESGFAYAATTTILQTLQILPYNDLLLNITLTNAISKLPEDGEEAPKHVGAFVI